MPITDAQVEAAARAIAVAYEEDPDVPIDGPGHECPLWWVFRDQARHALEAAEDAAWNNDMTTFPRDRAVQIWPGPYGQIVIAKWKGNGRDCYWDVAHLGVRACMSLTPTHWRPLPALPKSADQEADDD